jgi:transcriptional regulator with XRE-family HTH domain
MTFYVNQNKETLFVNAGLLSDTIYYMERREISVRYEEFLPQRLTQLRMQKNVSARDMSLSLGQANNYINSIENRKALPSMQSFFYICEYLGVTPQEFFDEGNACPVRLRELMDEAKRLDDNALGHLLALMRELNAGR